MKKILFAAFLILGSFGLAQAQTDYCKDIKKEVDEMKGKTSFTTPRMGRLDNMYLLKNFSPDGTGYISIFFSTTKEDAAYDFSGLYIKFNDGSVLRYGDQSIDCSYLNADDHYFYITGRLLLEDDFVSFKTKKIVSFQIANKTLPITDAFATKFMAWVNCIIDLK